MVETRSRTRRTSKGVAQVVRNAKTPVVRVAKKGARLVRLATGYERCPDRPHTVDCSLVDAAPGQAERCVTDEADCRRPHRLVTTYDYSRPGKWKPTDRQRDLQRKQQAAEGAVAQGGKLLKVGAKAGARAVVAEAAGATSAVVSGVVGGARLVDKSARATWRFGKRQVARSAYFYEQYSQILEADVALPDESNAVWSKPKEATALLQQYLAQHYELPAKSRSSSKSSYGRTIVKPDGRRKSEKTKPVSGDSERDPLVGRPKCHEPPTKTLDEWQRAVGVPALRVQELLVVASTGTGKSIVWARAARIWYEKGLRIVVLVNDQAQAQSQFQELVSSPSWHDLACDGALDKLVSVGEKHKTKPILLLTYTQAGNMVQDFRTKKPFATSDLDGTAIVMDEVHELATPENAKGWADSMRAVVAWLALRRYAKLLGLTATPLVSIPTFVALLAQFTPKNMTPLATKDLDVHTDAPSAEQVACGVGGRQTLEASLRDKLEGLQVFYYSADRDAVDFATFNPPEVLEVDVPIVGADTFSVERKGGWKATTLEHHTRLDKIVDAAAPVVWQRLDVKRKALVFMSTKGMAVNMHRQLGELNKKASHFRLLLLTGDEKAGGVDGIKRAFGAAAPNAVLVTHLKFATGHTFDDTSAPARLGVRLIVSVQLRALKAVLQMEGRARRRMSHAGYAADERDIERVTLIPRANVKISGNTSAVGRRSQDRPKCAGKKKAECLEGCTWVTGTGCKAVASEAKQAAAAAQDVAPATASAVSVRRTCEHVFAEAVEAERGVYEAILRALYLVSYGRDAFWNLRPSFVESGRAGAPEDPTRAQKIGALLRAGARRAGAMGRAGWRAAWYDPDAAATK